VSAEPSGGSNPRIPAKKEKAGFGILTTGSLRLDSGAEVRGGSLGCFGEAADGSAAIQIRGGTVDGDVHAPTVLLADDASIQGRVFAQFLQTDSTASYWKLKRFKKKRLFVEDNVFEATEALSVSGPLHAVVVPSETTVELPAGSGTTIEVGAYGTLVLTGGIYRFESLVVGSDAHVVVRAPSRVFLARSLDLGERAQVMPPEESDGLVNLEVYVGSAGMLESPSARIGQDARLSAIVAVPTGRVDLAKQGLLRGKIYAQEASLAADAILEHVPGFRFVPDADCMLAQCQIDAVAGGTIKWSCESVPASAGVRCQDGNPCTDPDSCDGQGQCQAGPPFTLPQDAPCYRETCTPALGPFMPFGTACSNLDQCREPASCNGKGLCNVPGAPMPTGTPCDDGIPNNGDDTCYLGLCFGSLGQFDCLANNCSSAPGLPPDIDCWLQEHPSIAAGVRWVEPYGPTASTTVLYKDWEPWRKQELQDALDDAWAWYDGGMSTFPGTSLADPPANQRVLADLDLPATELDGGTQAWPLYVAHLAHSLMVEIRGLVPWSLCDYGYNPEMFNVLQANDFFWMTLASNPDYELTTPVTPSHPITTFPFLVNNGLIGQTRLETIGKLIDWSHRMQHYIGPYTSANVEAHWQYRGVPPQLRVLQGTTLDALAYSGFPTPKHWTRGCWGTSGFLEQMLRAVNIPVVVQAASSTCSHAVPYFPSEDKYLSHGDDPYSGFWKQGLSTYVPPGEEFLIDAATHAAWFSPQQGCTNVGRGPIDVMIDFPPDPLVQQYCNDKAQNLSHAVGSVYTHFQNWYSVQELETRGLWTNLAQRAIALQLCGGP
jgi:hypothetical protein